MSFEARNFFCFTLPNGAAAKESLRSAVMEHKGAVLALTTPDMDDPVFWEKRLKILQERKVELLTPAKQCADSDIFRSYLRQGCRHHLPGLLFSQELGCKALAALDILSEPSQVLTMPVFVAALHFHAQQAWGESKVSSVASDDLADGSGRFMALAVLLHSFVPYCRRAGASAALVQEFSEILENLLCRERDICLRETKPMDFLRYGTEVDALRAMLISHSLIRAEWRKTQKKQYVRQLRRKLDLFWRSLP